MLVAGLCCVFLIGCREKPAATVAPDPRSELEERLIGTWIGGGFGGSRHTFSKDGTYMREAPEPVGRAEGTWKLDGNRLTRSVAQNESVVDIVRFEEKFFQIRTADGSLWGYQRRE
jgi:hypothetical protein